MSTNKYIEANLAAARTAVQEMIKQWKQWNNTQDEQGKLKFIAAYAAAFTNCKVYIENYLKKLYPNEQKVPSKVTQDIRNIVNDFDAIEKVDDKRLQKALKDIDQLSRDAA